MGVGRMLFGLNVGGIIVKQVEDEMALMLMGANDPGVNWNVIGDQGVTGHAFVETEIFGRVAGINGIDLGFHPLPIAAGVEDLVDIEERKYWEPGNRVTNEVVGRMQGFGP